MSNDTAKTITTNIVPVQGTFEPLPPYECINLIGPAGTPFYAPINPILDGVSITNSTINSTTIGVTTPALAAFIKNLTKRRMRVFEVIKVSNIFNFQRTNFLYKSF